MIINSIDVSGFFTITAQQNQSRILPYLKDIGSQIVSKNRPALSKDQMTAIANKFKPEIFQFLLFDCPLGRLTISNNPVMMLYSYRYQRIPAKNEKILKKIIVHLSSNLDSLV